MYSTVNESVSDRDMTQKMCNTDEGDLEEVVEDELQKRHVVDTTLLLHFFGRKGKQDLKFEEFKM